MWLVLYIYNIYILLLFDVMYVGAVNYIVVIKSDITIFMIDMMIDPDQKQQNAAGNIHIHNYKLLAYILHMRMHACNYIYYSTTMNLAIG